MHYLLACLTLLPFLTEANPPVSMDNCSIEIIDNQKIVHLKGSSYEIGYQHGYLLKNEIAENVTRFLKPISSTNQSKLPIVVSYFLKALPQVISHIPNSLMEEMKGLADGSEQPFDTVLLLNLFPEMFHCSAVTVKGDASLNGELFHVRVLDYAQGNGIQNTAVITAIEPEEGIPFMNITYAGFVGAVTGMNLKKIAIGEIGGKGYGHWNGMPMAFLLRTILQSASNLDEIKIFLDKAPRTCEYFYVFSDGKTNESLGCYATPSVLEYFHSGESYTKSPPVPNAFEAPIVLPDYGTPYFQDKDYDQPKDVLMISRGDQYEILKDRLMTNYGHISLVDLQEAIKQPIANVNNLHNAIFAPKNLDVWVSHAGKSNEPACDQPYHHFNLTTLIGK